MSGPLKYYFDFMSQPSRALYIFFKKAKIPFEPVPVALRNGEHLDENFKKINRFQKVPCIIDSGFQLSESVAILRYLEREKSIDDFWYPKDSKKRAQVDEYLEWQHINTRMACAMYFQLKWLRPLMFKQQVDPKYLKEVYNRMVDCLDTIENVWLDSGKYIVGDNYSIADIFAACEIEQVRLAGYSPFEGRPRLAAWYERVKKESNPYYDEAHSIINKMIEKDLLNLHKNKL